MNRRTFFLKVGLTGLATALMPVMTAVGCNKWPEYDSNGRQLRQIYLMDGKWKLKRVRMKKLKSGDRFVTSDGPGEARHWTAESDPFVTSDGPGEARHWTAESDPFINGDDGITILVKTGWA